MKKLFAIVLAVIMIMTMVACTNQPKETEPQDTGLDLSAFPADLKDWSAEDYNKYFIQAGVFKEDIAYIQDHENYWINTPVYEGCGAMDEIGDVMVFIFTFDPEAKDADVPAFMEELRKTKTFPEDLNSMPMDHMAANACFLFQFSQSDEVYEAAEKAFNDLMTAMKVTPDF